MTTCSVLGMAVVALGASVPELANPVQLVSATDESELQFELYRDSRQRFRWRLKARNGRVIATSGDSYKAKADCRNAIELIRRDASTATLEDLT